MLTLLILFCAIYLLGGALGFVFHIAFHVFKWLFLAALVVGAILFAVLFAVPLLFILPVAAVIGLLFLGASLIF